MVEFEEETYSVVFTALKHPIRRKILRVLAEGPRGFTDMQRIFNVSSPFLTYHLESLKELVLKTESGMYRLSNMGEGATALMEKVEETPKTTPRDTASSRHKRIPSVLQLGLTIVAIGLVLSGWYLMSITTVEYRYPLPTETISYDTSETIDGSTFTTHICTRAPPPETLTINRVALLYVKFPSIDNTTGGIYNITIRYLEFSIIEGTYTPREKNYTGQFTPPGIDGSYIFSGFVSVPSSIGLSISQQPIPKDIVITVLTNKTAPIAFSPFIVESAMYGNGFMEEQPYRTQAFACMSSGVLILGASLITSVSIQIYERKKQN
jgi:DNA-binding transcriptional ArsR family regulator